MRQLHWPMTGHCSQIGFLDVHTRAPRSKSSEIKQTVDACIHEQVSHKDIGQVGVRFMQFCGKYELNKLSENADSFGRWMNETYKGVLNG